MKNLQLLLLNFRKKKWFNLIIMIEITIAITLFIFVLGKINYYTEPLRVFDEKKLENVFIYGGGEELLPMGKYNEKIENFKKVFEKNKDKLASYGKTYGNYPAIFKEGSINNLEYEKFILNNGKISPEGNLGAIVAVYDWTIGKNLTLPLASGKNFSEIKLKDNIVPVILNNDLKDIFKIGDKKKLTYRYPKNGNEQYSYDENGEIIGYGITFDEIEIEIEVVGFLDKNNSAFSLNGDGYNYFPMFHIYQREHEEDMILLRTADNPLGQLDIKQEGLSWLVEIKPEYIKEKQAIIDEFNSIGSTYTFDEIIKGQKEQMKLDIKIPLINLIIALIITIISIAGLNILIKVSEKKKYGIYYACGCTWKKCVVLDILKGILLIIIPTMLAFTVATIIGKQDYFMALTPSVYWLALAMAGAIYFISDFLFNIKMYKTKPVDNLREVE